jgi:hypothetical protein
VRYNLDQRIPLAKQPVPTKMNTDTHRFFDLNLCSSV